MSYQNPHTSDVDSQNTSSSLSELIMCDNIDFVKQLETILSSTDKLFDMQQALFEAVNRGNVEILNFVLQCKDVVIDLSTVLEFAIVNHSSKDIVHTLIISGADVNRLFQQFQCSPLMYCISKGNIELVELLLIHGVNINHPTNACALNAAIGVTNDILIRLLVKHGAALELDEESLQHLSKQLMQCPDHSLLSNLIYTLVIVEKILDDHSIPRFVIAACKSRSFELLKELLRFSNDVNFINEHGRTALMESTTIGDSAAVKLLIDFGAEVDLKNHDGESALLIGVRLNRKNVVKILLENDANVDETDNDGKTPLALACYSSRSMVDLLLEYGADIHIRDNRGNSVKTHCYSQVLKSHIIQTDTLDTKYFAQQIISSSFDKTITLFPRNRVGCLLYFYPAQRLQISPSTLKINMYRDLLLFLLKCIERFYFNENNDERNIINSKCSLMKYLERELTV